MSVEQIVRCARFACDNNGTGPLSTGEGLAAALVLNRTDWLKDRGYTVLEAIRRIESGGWTVQMLDEAREELGVGPRDGA